MKRVTLPIFGLLVSTATAPASAQERFVRVVGEGAAAPLLFPIPDGYCDGASTRLRSSSDGPGDAVLVRCDESLVEGDIEFIKLHASGTKMARARLLGVAREKIGLDSGDPAPTAADLKARAIAEMTAASDDRDGSADSRNVATIGLDDVCGYTAGVLFAPGIEPPLPTLMELGCVSAGDGEGIVLFHYRNNGPDVLASRMPVLRAIAQGARHE